MVTGLIQDDNKSAYQREVEQLVFWCSQNNLELNMLKPVEMTVHFQGHPSALLPLTISNSSVSTMETFKFLGTTISQDLKWETNIISILKKTHQRMCFLQQMWKLGLPQELLNQLYTVVIDSVLSITVWFGAATKEERSRLRQTVETAEKSSLQEPGNGQGKSLQIPHTLDPDRHYRPLYTLRLSDTGAFSLLLPSPS